MPATRQSNNGGKREQGLQGPASSLALVFPAEDARGPNSGLCAVLPARPVRVLGSSLPPQLYPFRVLRLTAPPFPGCNPLPRFVRCPGRRGAEAVMRKRIGIRPGLSARPEGCG